MNILPSEIREKINDYVNDLEELDYRKEIAKDISNDILDHFYSIKLKKFYEEHGPFSNIMAFCLIIFIYLINSGNITKENEYYILYSFILFIVLIISIFPLRN